MYRCAFSPHDLQFTDEGTDRHEIIERGGGTMDPEGEIIFEPQMLQLREYSSRRIEIILIEPRAQE